MTEVDVVTYFTTWVVSVVGISTGFMTGAGVVIGFMTGIVVVCLVIWDGYGVKRAAIIIYDITKTNT
jgi:hypothetical protein